MREAAVNSAVFLHIKGIKGSEIESSNILKE